MTTATGNTSNNNSIRAIDKESVHRICSGQVVLDMATAVKELLENSLDAGSTSIVIKFKQSGLDHITVTDNGCGITDANLVTLALKHYTSKLSSFNDLAQVRSFGFRGEALSSLCALANLTVTTSTGTSPTGVLVEYTSDGVIKSKTPTPMTKGSTVKICNLFEGMPVRRSEFVKNIKREYVKCIGLIQAYALIVPNVRISCVSQTDKKPPVTQIATSGNASIRQNIINVFGPKAMMDVTDFELLLVEGKSGSISGSSTHDQGANSTADNEDEDDDEQNQKGDIVLTGYISSPAFGKGRSSADRQYIFINGRPCVLPKIVRVVNEVYHSFNTNQSPFLVANLILPTSYYDVNVSPDKRTIFLHNERMIVEELRVKLTELFEPSRSTFAVSEARQLIKKPDLAARLKSGSIAPEGSSPSRVQGEDEFNDDDDVDGDESNENQDIRSEGKISLSIPVALSSLSLSHSATKSIAGPTFTTVSRLEQTTLTDRMRPAVRVNGLKRKAGDSDSEQDEEPPVEDRSSITTAESHESASDLIIPANSTLPSDTTLDIMEGYDPLDDRTHEGLETTSDSEEEQERSSQQQQRQRLSKLQRVVILDSEVHQDGDREWVEVGFNMEEQRRRRAFRMKIIQESRRLEQERAVLREERQQRRLIAREQRSHATTATSSLDDQHGVEPQDEDADDADRTQTSVGLRRSCRQRSQKLSDASFANMDDAKAQKSLSRVISKGDFTRMKILGQFNKAFIVARLDNYATLDTEQQRKPKRGALISSDIFVIDQHASDEKYNFETLQAKTVFSTQRMLQPKKLYLTAQEEITVVEHMKMLNKNGFYLDYDPDAPVSHRLRLVTLPVSEKVVFDLQDFEELVFLLSQQTSLPSGSDEGQQDEDNNEGHHHHRHGSGKEKMVRCSKVRALFASRACRRSVMIGHVLNHSQMKKIVRHMGDINQPWNCPHGRPTMRHLLDLAELEQQERRVRLGAAAAATAARQDDDDDEYDDGDEGEDVETGTKTDDTLLELEAKLLNVDRTGAFDPIALKRPTRHQGSLFRQFMAIPSPRTHVSL